MRPNEPKGERKNMKMTFRWYGSQSDKITLKQIKQIPGCTGLMGVLDYKAAGEVWEEDEIKCFPSGAMMHPRPKSRRATQVALTLAASMW